MINVCKRKTRTHNNHQPFRGNPAKKTQASRPLRCSKCLWWELHCAPEPDDSHDATLASTPSLAESSWITISWVSPQNCRAGSNESTLQPSHWTSTTHIQKHSASFNENIQTFFSASGLCANIFALATWANVGEWAPGGPAFAPKARATLQHAILCLAESPKRLHRHWRIRIMIITH